MNSRAGFNGRLERGRIALADNCIGAHCIQAGEAVILEAVAVIVSELLRNDSAEPKAAPAGDPEHARAYILASVV